MKYGPIGFCVYCGAEESLPYGVLSSEHIIPEGLGGEDEILGASCRTCAGITSEFERRCLRGFFAEVRAFLGAYGRRRPETRPQEFPVVLKTPEGEVEVDVPLADNPFWLMMLTMPPPGFLLGRSKDADKKGISCHPVMISERGRVEKLAAVARTRDGTTEAQQTVTWDPGAFWKLLAKVAHCYAVAYRGYGSFRPFLTEFIRGCDEQGGAHFVGGAYSAEGLPIESLGSSPGLHEARISEISDGRRNVLVARLQLFAPLRPPVYDVAAGAL